MGGLGPPCVAGGLSWGVAGGQKYHENFKSNIVGSSEDISLDICEEDVYMSRSGTGIGPGSLAPLRSEVPAVSFPWSRGCGMSGGAMAGRSVPHEPGGGRGTGSGSLAALGMARSLVPVADRRSGLQTHTYRERESEGHETWDEVTTRSKLPIPPSHPPPPTPHTDLRLVPSTLLLRCSFLVRWGLLVPALALPLRLGSSCFGWQLSRLCLLQNGLVDFPL